MHDLGVVPGTNCSFPFWINASGQVVGDGGNDCAYGFLWEGGGPMVDLNTLISSQSGFSISGAPGVSAVYINDQGEIFGKGTPAGCDDAEVCGHDYVLIPCDENHPGIEGCDYSLVDSAAAAEVPPARTRQQRRILPRCPRAERALDCDPRCNLPGSGPRRRLMRGRTSVIGVPLRRSR